MSKDKHKEMPEKSEFVELENLIYSGRGIMVGVTPNNERFMGYTLTGRSPSSQARKLVQAEESKIIRTAVTDEEQLKKGNPALLLYPAIVPTDSMIIGSNGVQTNNLFSVLKEFKYMTPKDLFNYTFAEKGDDWQYDANSDTFINVTRYEPDKPNFTPRIFGAIMDGTAKKALAGIGMVMKQEGGGRRLYTGETLLKPGNTMMATTYLGGNENPLLPSHDRLVMDTTLNTAENIVKHLYKAISHGANPEDNYAVSAAVVLRKQNGNLDTAILNRHD